MAPPSDAHGLTELQRGWDLRQATEEAFRQGDTAGGRALLSMQEEEATNSNAVMESVGLDPETNMLPSARFLSPEVESIRQGAIRIRRNRRHGEIMEEQWQPFQAFQDQIYDSYRFRNAGLASRFGPNMTPEETQKFMEQSEPITVDPNEVANLRQSLVKLDNELKAELGPKYSVFTHPKTRSLAAWVNREVGGGMPGYFQSGEQEVPMGVKASQVADSAATAVMDLGLAMMDKLSGGDGEAWWARPTNYIEDENGRPIYNGGRLTFASTLVATRAYMWDQDIQRAVGQYQKAQEWEQAQRSGMNRLIHATASIAPSIMVAGPLAGQAMASGAGLMRGLTWLATGGRVANMSDKAQKIIRVLGNTSGAMAGNGLMEMTLFGHPEGAAKAFFHGVAMAPVYLGLGWMGTGASRWMQQRRMPRRMSDSIGGGMEGLGFGTIELAGMKPLWRFLQDPTEENWNWFSDVIGPNMLAMMLIKGAHRRTPFDAMTEEIMGMRSEVETYLKGAPTRELETIATDLETRRAVREEKGVPRETQERQEQVMMEERKARGVRPLEAAGKAVERRELERDVRRRERGIGTSETARRERRQKLRDMGEQQAFETTIERGQRAELERELAGIEREQAERVSPAAEFFAGKSQLERDRLMMEGKARTEKEDRRKRELTAEIAERKARVERREVEEEGMRTSEQYFARKTQMERDLFMTEERARTAERGEAEVSRLKREGPTPANRKRLLELMEQTGMELVSKAAATLGNEWGKVGKDPAFLRELAKRRREEGPPPEDLGPPEGEEPERLYERRPPPDELARAEFERQIAVEAKPGATPTRASDVVLSIQGFKGEPLRVPIRKGGVPKRAHGYLETREDLIRTEGIRDIANHLHEWAHFLQKKTVGIGVKAKSTLADLQMQQLSEGFGGTIKDTKSARAEGWAEFWAREMLDDPNLAIEFPELHAEMMEFMGAQPPGVVEHYLRIKRDVRNYLDQGARARLHKGVVTADDPASPYEKRARGSLTARILRSIDESMLHDISELRNIEAEYLGDPRDRPITESPTRLLDVQRMTATRITESMLRHGIVSPTTGERTNNGLRDVFKPFDTAEKKADLMDYLVARKAWEMEERGMRSGFHRADILYVLDTIPKTTPEVVNATRRIKGFWDALMDYAVEMGSLTESEATKIKDAWTMYIPFQRLVGGPAGGPRKERRTVPGEIKRIKGGSEEIRDPFDAMVDLTRAIVARGQQTTTLKALYKLHLTQEGIGGLVTTVDRDTIPKNVALRDVLDALKREAPLGEAGEVKDLSKQLQDIFNPEGGEGLDPTITLFNQSAFPRGDKFVFAFIPKFTEAEIVAEKDHKVALQMDRANGKLLWLEVDPKVYNSLVGIDQPVSRLIDSMPAPIAAFLTAPARLVRLGATALSPAFTVANVLRDIRTFPLYTQDPKWWHWIPYAATADFVHHFGKMTQDNPKWMNFLAGGGEGMTFFGVEVRRGRAGKQLFDIKSSGVKETMSKILGRTMDILSKPEQVLRFTEYSRVYDRAIADGKTHWEANLLGLEGAKEVTVNFTRGGALARGLNQLIPYLNPGIQGRRKFVRTLLGHDGKRAQLQLYTRGVADIGAFTALVYLMHGDEDWYQDLPDWKRINNWNFRIPFTEEIVSIPKPFEPGMIFSVPFEIALDVAMGRDPVDTKEALWDITKGFFNDFSLLPAFLGPSLEVAGNFSLFYGREIVPDWMEDNRLPKDRFFSYTTETAKGLGAFLGVSPAKIEYWLSQQTGGLGLKLMRTFDWVTQAESYTREQPSAALGFGFGRFLSRQHQRSRAVETIRNLESELRQKAGSGEITDKELGMQAAINAARQQITELNRLRQDGLITREAADRQAYEIAAPVVRQYREEVR